MTRKPKPTKVPESSDPVCFLDGTSGNVVKAEIVKINDDGTLDLLYPHPFAAGTLATADGVKQHKGAWGWWPFCKADLTEPGEVEPPPVDESTAKKDEAAEQSGW